MICTPPALLTMSISDDEALFGGKLLQRIDTQPPLFICCFCRQ